jgi:hypothetical protein
VFYSPSGGTYGIDIQSGSVQCYGLSVHFMQEIIRIASPSDIILIDGIDSEGCGQLVDAGSSGAAHCVTFKNGRIQLDGASETEDFVEYVRPGPFKLENIDFSGPMQSGDERDFKLEVRHPSAGCSFEMNNCIVANTFPWDDASAGRYAHNIKLRNVRARCPASYADATTAHISRTAEIIGPSEVMPNLMADFAPPSAFGAVFQGDASIVREGFNSSNVRNWVDRAGTVRTARTSVPAWQPYTMTGKPQVVFDGTDDNLIGTPLGAHDALNPGVGSFFALTVVRLVSLPASSQFECIAGKSSNSTGDNWRLMVDDQGRPQLFWGDDTEFYTVCSSAIPLDTDYLVGAGIDAATNEVVYITGISSSTGIRIQRSSVTISGTGSNSENLYIASDTAGAKFANIGLTALWFTKGGFISEDNHVLTRAGFKVSATYSLEQN